MASSDLVGISQELPRDLTDDQRTALAKQLARLAHELDPHVVLPPVN